MHLIEQHASVRHLLVTQHVVVAGLPVEQRTPGPHPVAMSLHRGDARVGHIEDSHLPARLEIERLMVEQDVLHLIRALRGALGACTRHRRVRRLAMCAQHKRSVRERTRARQRSPTPIEEFDRLWVSRHEIPVQIPFRYSIRSFFCASLRFSFRFSL